MKKRVLYSGFSLALAGLLLLFGAGCSTEGEKQQTEEKGRIDKMTDQAADSAVKKIRTPMDKARETQHLGDKRAEEIDKLMQKQ